MMKKSLIAIALMGAFTATAANAANIDNTVYVGAGAALSNYNHVDTNSNLGAHNAFGWNALVGYSFNKYFAVEAGWQDFGTNKDVKQTGVSEGQQVKVRGATLGLVGTLPLNDNWFLTGEAGAIQYHIAHTIKTGQYVSDNDTAPYAGVGIGYNITDNLAVAAKYRYFHGLDENQWNTADMNAQTVGVQLTYRFGVKADPVIAPVVVAPVVKPVVVAPKYVTKTDTNKTDVFFGFNSSSLTDAAIAKLNNVIKLSHEGQKSSVVLVGQADNQGNPAYNMKLSQKRVEKVAEYLKANGVNTTSLDVTAVGSEDAKGNTIADHKLDRKVVVTLTTESQVLVK